jgi:DNA-binding transcriptional MerR regulator
MSELEFPETTGSVSRDARCLPDTVRRYADGGLIEYRRLADGTRVFRPDAAARVRQIMKERRRKA